MSPENNEGVAELSLPNLASYRMTKASQSLAFFEPKPERLLPTAASVVAGAKKTAVSAQTIAMLAAIASAQATAAVSTLLGDDQSYRPPNDFLQLKSDGIDVGSAGSIKLERGDEEYAATADGDTWWRLIVRDDRIRAGLYVGPPGSSKAFTRALRNRASISKIKSALRQGSLEGISELADS